jgi:tungstate transport system substrate-binding protein
VKKLRSLRWLSLLLLVGGLVAGCTAPWDDDEEEPRGTLRLATTTSTQDSGLLDAILPAFEEEYNAEVEVIALGTGQAIELGERGDADVLMVHSRRREDEFVANGFGVNRQDVMSNDFIIVGPADDPAGVASATSAGEAFIGIAMSESLFNSRDDESGTHDRELSVWETAGIEPSGDWYQSLGQGMGETLVTANEQNAYTLTDRATYLTMRDELPNLTIVFGGETVDQNPDPSLMNPYGVILVNPERFETVNEELGNDFIAWLTSAETGQMIAEFGREEFGQSIFQPVNQ